MSGISASWVVTAELLELAELESARLFEVVGEYPPEWPAVSWLVKRIARGRCEHCGRRRRLAVHHLDRDKHNLQHWNLVALCWASCHLWVETHLSLDRDQLDLFDRAVPWLAWRVADRERWPVSSRRRDRRRLPPRPVMCGEDGAAGAACACGCGARVAPGPRGRRRRYFSQACRQRVYREARREQLSLLGPVRVIP